LLALEINIFHAQPTTFHQSQTGTLEQSANQLHGTCWQRVEPLADFVNAEPDRDMSGRLGSHGIHLERHLEHFSKQKQQGEERLILRTGGDLSFDGQIGQERFNMAVFDFRRVYPSSRPIATEAEKPFHSTEIGSLDADRPMLDAHQRPGLLEQLRFERSRPHFSHNELSRRNRDWIRWKSR
jgi:hypothetical protein